MGSINPTVTYFAKRGEDTNLDRPDCLPRACHPKGTLSAGTEPVQVVPLFGGKLLISLFQTNPRASRPERDKQLKLFDL